MLDRAQILIPSSKEELSEVIKRMPDGGVGYFKPILEAMYDCDIQVAAVPQNEGPFSLPFERPAVIIFQDSHGKSLGPTAFEASSIKAILNDVLGVIIVSALPTESIYLIAAHQPVKRGGNCLIIETTQRHEADWADWVHERRPHVPMLISMPERQGTIQ
jgi:hypothetical protein